jgi:hypothetical protein
VISPKTLLPWLLGGAVGLGGIIQGLHWRSSSRGESLTNLQDQLRMASDENTMLKKENESLRSLAQGGGELAVPRELIDRLIKEYELNFLSNPVVHRIATEELRDRIAAALESRFGPAGIDDRQEAYRWIGWLDADTDLLFQLTAVRSVGAKGWFDDVTGDAWVTDRFESEAVPDQAVLVRLLTRMLLHQHFPPPPAYPGDDAARAREAIHQGAAAGAEARFLAANARAIGFMPLKENHETKQLFASLSSFVRELSAFPALAGKGLTDTLFVKGNKPFQELFRDPPQTTRAILKPGTDSAAPPALEIPTQTEDPYLSETAGQLGLRLWLSPTIGESEAIKISNHWKNDRFLLIPDGESSTAVIWDIELDSKESADLLETSALRILAKMAAATDVPTSDSTLKAPKGRLLCVTRRSPEKVRFINAATEKIAEKVE